MLHTQPLQKLYNLAAPRPMTKTKPPQSAAPRPLQDGQYRIAAVAKLAGVPVPTLRMWERRYSAVEPARSPANGRLYTRADIERLILLKAAVDAGHAISTVVSLGDAQIRQRLSAVPGRLTIQTRAACPVLVCGQALTTRLQAAWQGRSDVRVSGTLASLAAADLNTLEPADVLIVELPSLPVAALRGLRQLRALTQAQLVIVIYTFGTRQALSRLDEEGVIALSAPADPAQLARLCRLGLGLAPAETGQIDRLLLQAVAPRRYPQAFLDQLSHHPSQVQCECPNHLADLLTKLYAFEHYSAECESLHPADAALHGLLHSAAGQSRKVLEQALQEVLQHEGIAAPSLSDAPVAARP